MTENQLQTSEKREVSEHVEQTRPGPTYSPAVDIYEEPTAITVLADMPGVKSEDLEIDLRDGVLTLSSEVASRAGDEEAEVFREYEPGTYYRQFRLSDRIDQERIDAKLVDGVLTLVLPKVEAAKPRQIEVKTS